MDDTTVPVMVTLPESLLLLATDDDTGRIASKSGALDYRLAGAVLTELLLANRLEANDGTVTVVDATATGASALDGALAKVMDSRPRDAKHWIRKLAKGHLKDRVIDGLTQKGLVRREEHRFLWVIPDDRYFAEDGFAERGVRETIRATVVGGQTLQPRTAILIGLVKACDLLGVLFSRDERKQCKARIDDIASSDVMGQAVAKAIRDMQGAMAAVIASSAVAGASAGSS